jgi:AcrR family transcriptional regulator
MAETTPSRPHGRDEVVAALIATAATLFAERGPAAVSLRDVATAADVNLGLIHRYIGSKEDLLAAVLAARPGMAPLQTYAERSPVEVVEALIRAAFTPAPYMTLFLRAGLDGYDVKRLQRDFPLILTVAKSVRRDLPRRDADLRVALLTATVFGWYALGPIVLDILGQDNLTPDEVATTLRPAIEALLAASPS